LSVGSGDGLIVGNEVGCDGTGVGFSDGVGVGSLDGTLNKNRRTVVTTMSLAAHKSSPQTEAEIHANV
jgi:hypothetical protein